MEGEEEVDFRSPWEFRLATLCIDMYRSETQWAGHQKEGIPKAKVNKATEIMVNFFLKTLC